MTTPTTHGPQRRIIADPGINWCWYLVADFDDATMTCRVINYDRKHYNDAGHPPAEHPALYLVESPDAKRIVTHVTLGNSSYVVTNPRNIFDYRRHQ